MKSEEIRGGKKNTGSLCHDLIVFAGYATVLLK